MLVTVSGSVFSEVVSGFAGSIRAGLSWGSSAVITTDVISAVASAAASANDGASTPTSNTRSQPYVRSSRKSHVSTANAHTSKAKAKTTAAMSRRFKVMFAPTSHCVVLDLDAAWRRDRVPMEPGLSPNFG
jgi:hypothetical protein